MRYSRWLFLLPTAIYLFYIHCATSKPQSYSLNGHDIHTPAQLLKIMEKSDLLYELDVLKETDIIAQDSLDILINQIYRIENDSAIFIHVYDLADSVRELFEKGEMYFHNKDYDHALHMYRKVQEIRPDYYDVYDMIGDLFYFQGQYDSAKYYFKKAIAHNYIDYTAHWFLAETEWKNGSIDSAMTHITLAHLFNVNHETIFEQYKLYRTFAGQPWNNWNFKPKYKIRKNGRKISVHADPEWIGYAMVKALWQYEPGYKAMMLGRDHPDENISIKEEAEAIIMAMANNEKLAFIQDIVTDGYLIEFIEYEIVAPRLPSTLLLMQKEKIARLIIYLNKYH